MLNAWGDTPADFGDLNPTVPDFQLSVSNVASAHRSSPDLTISSTRSMALGLKKSVSLP
jgi:hypothetical protein